MNKKHEDAIARASRLYCWTHEGAGDAKRIVILAPQQRGGHRVCALDGNPHSEETYVLADCMTDALNRRLARLERAHGH